MSVKFSVQRCALCCSPSLKLSTCDTEWSASSIPLVHLRSALEEQTKNAFLDVSYVASLSLLDIEFLYAITSSRVTRKQMIKRREKTHSLME